MVINGYNLQQELKNANSGFSKWGFAEKYGRDYFLKELITPVYPTDADSMTEEMFQKRLENCRQFENTLGTMFERINRASRGNLVRIIDFFREGSRYYLVSEKMYGCVNPEKHVSSLSHEKKLLLLITAAYGFYDLHSVGVVHFDVKPSNIIVTKTASGNFTAKVIDFDSGFLKGDMPEGDELGGDLVYLAPETFLRMCGENVDVDEKTDIFALGLIFHQYYCGQLPWFNNSEYEYPYEAVLDKGGLTVNREIPYELAELINSMISEKPEDRPSAEQIIMTLRSYGRKGGIDRKIPERTVPKSTGGLISTFGKPSGGGTQPEKPAANPTSGWFSPGGDL